MSFQVREGGGFGGFLIASTYASACLRVDAAGAADSSTYQVVGF